MKRHLFTKKAIKEYFSTGEYKDRPRCSVKGCNKFAHNAGKRTNGSIIWRKNPAKKDGYLCGSHHIVRFVSGEHSYRAHAKNYCENKDCTTNFNKLPKELLAIFPFQVDHIDGNPANNHPSNLMTLCPNCHHLKTMLNRDAATHGRKYYKSIA